MKPSPKAQAALDGVVERFKSGDISPVVEMTRIKLPEDAPVAKWSFGNRVMAFAQANTIDCRGYRQWESAGRQVKKGERAAYIFGPILVPDENDDGEKYSRLVGFRPIPVFGYHQTDGENGLTYEPKEPPPLMDVAERLGIAVKWGPMVKALGNCTTGGDTITVGADQPRTFWHELAHACHARIENGLKGGQDARQETIAEFTACVLAQMYGHDYTGNAWDYISSYNSDPLKAIFSALSTVEKVIALIEGEA